MIPRSRFRHRSVTLEAGRLVAALVIGVMFLGVLAAVSIAAVIGVILWAVGVGMWRRWNT